MKRLVCVTSFAAWLSMVTLASAQAQPAPGMGGVQCGDYLKAARTSGILYHQASNWLLGYLSGMNAALAANGGAAAQINLSGEQALKSAGDYCEAHPARTIAEAAGAWFSSLPKQAAQPPARSGGSLILNLDRAPKIRPLLDRH